MWVLKLANISLEEFTLLEEKRMKYNVNEPVENLPNKSRILLALDPMTGLSSCYTEQQFFWDAEYLIDFINCSRPARVNFPGQTH